MIGTQIGNYRIESELGSGGMGTVYRGTELNLDRPVAIKVLNPEFGRKPEILERFRAEAKAQANLNHTNVATLYAFIIQEGSALMVMEFVDGENFQQMVNRRGAIPYTEAIPLFQQALAGIGAAHRMGIVHRDMKPANIMRNKQGVVKVMDFGIAKLMGERGMTRTGTQIGTVFYMSPEQVKGQGADERSDIYALGVTLYEILTARVPFMAESEFEVLTSHVNSAPPPLSTSGALIPKSIEHAVLKALAKRPQDRFQTVAEFSRALERMDVDMVSPSMATTADLAGSFPVRDLDLTRPPLRPKKRERPWIAFVVGMLVVSGLGLGGFLLLSHKPVRPDSPTAAVIPRSVQTSAPAATEIIIPAGTDVVVGLNSSVDSAVAVPGQVFPATVESPIVGEGRTLVESGGNAQVRLVRFVKAKRFEGAAKMEFELSSLISGGTNYRVQSNRFAMDGTRGKFLGFGAGTMKIPSGISMSFTLTDAVTVTAR